MMSNLIISSPARNAPHKSWGVYTMCYGGRTATVLVMPDRMSATHDESSLADISDERSTALLVITYHPDFTTFGAIESVLREGVDVLDMLPRGCMVVELRCGDFRTLNFNMGNTKQAEDGVCGCCIT